MREKPMTCEETKIYYYDCLQGDTVIPEAVSSHIEQCSYCRGEIERLRQMLDSASKRPRSYTSEFLGLHYALAGRWVSCKDVRPLLTSLLAADFSVHNATPVTAHFEHCRQCRQDLEAIAALKLSGTDLMRLSRYFAGEDELLSDFDATIKPVLRDMNSRGRGDVLTRTTLTEKPEGATEGTWLSDMYTVDVKRRRRETAAVRPAGRRVAVPAFVTTGIAAAILFAVMLIIPSEKAQALDLSQVYQGIKNVQNVHIRILSEDFQEVQSIWISEPLQARLFQQEGETVFWDERSGEILQREGGATRLLSHFDNADKLERPWGLLPFKHISELPADKAWTYIKDAEINGVPVQVYELIWAEMGIHRTWRGYLDIQTHLPYRVEWIEQLSGDFPAITFVTEVYYPTDQECRDVFQQEGFTVSFYGAQQDLVVTIP